MLFALTNKFKSLIFLEANVIWPFGYLIKYFNAVAFAISLFAPIIKKLCSLLFSAYPRS